MLSSSPYCVPSTKRSVFARVSPVVGTSVLSRGEEAGRGVHAESCRGRAGWRVRSFIHSAPAALSCSEDHTSPVLVGLWSADGECWNSRSVWVLAWGWHHRDDGVVMPSAGKSSQVCVNLVCTLWPAGQGANAGGRGRDPIPEGPGFLWALLGPTVSQFRWSFRATCLGM